jgi:hypothetical protein
MSEDDDTLDALRAAIDALEAVVDDRTVLAGLDDEERRRLLEACRTVFAPTPRSGDEP